VPLGVRILNFLNLGVFYPKSTQKGAWLGIFSANKCIEYLDAILHALTDYRQIAQEYVEKLCTHGIY